MKKSPQLNMEKLKERTSRTSLTFAFSSFVFAILLAATALTALGLWLLTIAGVIVDVNGALQIGRVIPFMLLISLLTLPQITVNLFTSDFKRIMVGSIAIGFLGCVSGLLLSYYLNVPSGAFIILFLVLLFLISKAIKAVVTPLNKE